MQALLEQPAGVGVATHCPYCALQCGMVLRPEGGRLAVTGRADFPVNRGGLCLKGWTSTETVNHPDRLRAPLARDAAGRLVEVSWDVALQRIAGALAGIQQRHGHAAVGVLGGGSLTNETAYLLGKFARVALRTPNIDYNGRFCMSCAAAGQIQAFGLDRGLPFPIEDLASADVILLAGSNLAETMPPVMRHLEAQRAGGGKLVVADPRASRTSQAASIHLQLLPGSDVALANGLLHACIQQGLVDREYVRERTTGFEAARAAVAAYWPARVERLSGIPASQLAEVAALLGSARRAIILTGRGTEQHSHGVDCVLAWINLALALGLPGRLGSGFGPLTGQGNGQGGREHGQKADQLPGYRKIDDPDARRHVAAVWGVEESDLPGPGLSAYELLDSLGQEKGVRGLLVMATNPAVSAPRALHVIDRLRQLDVLIVADFFLSETAKLADVVLPAAQWAEDGGTTTNLEGRVILRRAVAPLAGDARPDWRILCDLARLLGASANFRFEGQGAIFAELRRASAGGPADYSGITYERLAREDGVFWPCPSGDHPGSPRLFAERFPMPDGRARFHAVKYRPPAEEADARYPVIVTTGRVLSQYQSGTQTRRVAELVRQAPEPLVEMHPSLAARFGLHDGQMVRLRSRRGSIALKARVTNSIRPDTVFVPFHWGGQQAANNLTNPALDPVSRMPEFKVCAAAIEPISTGGELD